MILHFVNKKMKDRSLRAGEEGEASSEGCGRDKDGHEAEHPGGKHHHQVPKDGEIVTQDGEAEEVDQGVYEQTPSEEQKHIPGARSAVSSVDPPPGECREQKEQRKGVAQQEQQSTASDDGHAKGCLWQRCRGRPSPCQTPSGPKEREEYGQKGENSAPFGVKDGGVLGGGWIQVITIHQSEQGKETQRQKRDEEGQPEAEKVGCHRDPALT